MISVELPSAPMLSTPSLINYLKSGYWHRPDRKKLRTVLTEGFGLSSECAGDLLSGRTSYTVKDGSVWFDYPEEKVRPAMAT